MNLLPLLLLATTPLQDPSFPDDRTAVAPTITYGGATLSAELHGALLKVLDVESEIELLTRTTKPSGEQYTREEYDERLFAEGSELGKFLEPRLPRFGYGIEAPHITECFDSIRHDSGFQAMESLLAERPDFKSTELLELFTSDFVKAKPILGTELADQYHTQQVAAGRLAPLCNAGALGYLTWGLLYSDTYWEPEAHDREAFLVELIDRGFDSLLVARVVTRSLEEPLLFESNPGRGIAGSLTAMKGKVGFTTIHEQQLMADLKVVAALEGSLEARLDPDLDVRRVKLEIDATGTTTAKMPRRGHLKVWLPATLMQVRMELYPTGANDKMRRGETLEERQTYWARAFATLGFVAARDLALDELRALVAGDDSFPGAPELKVLEDRLAAGVLAESDRARLEELRAARTKLGDSMVTDLVKLIAGNGVHDFYDLTTSTLAVELPELLAPRQGAAGQDALNYGWVMLSFEHDERAVETVQKALTGEYNLGDGMGQLILDLARHERTGSREVLEQVLEQGTVANRATALMESEWLDADRYDKELDSLAAVMVDPAVALGTTVRLRSQLMLSLRNRKDTKDVKRFLERTLAQGHLKQPKGTGLWGGLAEQNLDFVMDQFTGAELEEFTGLGLLHPDYLPAKDD